MNKKPYEAVQMSFTFFEAEEVLAASGAYAPSSVDPDDLPIMPAK